MIIQNSYLIGLDISTATIGITLMDCNDRLIEIDYVSFPKKSKKNPQLSIYDKAEYFKKTIKKYESFNIKHIFIEEPLKNGPNINTTILLAKFNGIISQIMFEKFKIEPEHITVYESRKSFFPELIIFKKVKNEIIETLSFPKDCDKKKIVWDKVSWLEPHAKWDWTKFFKLKIENYDMADSYVVAKSGLLKKGYITEIPKLKK